MIGTPCAQCGRHESATSEALQSIPLGVGLANPLEPLGPHPDELARLEQPLGVRVAGQRVSGPTRHRAHEGQGEHHIGAEHSQLAMCWVMVGKGHLGHERVESDGARVVGNDQGAAVSWHVLDPVHLDPEPLLVERAHRGHKDVAGELSVEAEVVDLVRPLQPTPQEAQGAGQLLLSWERRTLVVRLALGIERDHPGIAHAEPPPMLDTGAGSSGASHGMMRPSGCARRNASNVSSVEYFGTNPS